MKKYAALIILTILILTSAFVFVACGDKVDANDPILGWYVGVKGSSSYEFIHFSIQNGKLMYSYSDKDNYTEVTKNKDGQYIVNDVTYTLDATNHDEKWISNRNDFTVGNGLYKFVASADKSYDEARDIFSTSNPWVIHNEILGWYHNAEKGFLHIYVSGGYLVWSYNNDNSDKHLNYSSVWEDGTKAYKSGTITFLFEYISEQKKTIYLHSSVVTDVYVYAFAAPFDKAFEDLN